jgi:hypothetical protein
MKSKNARIEDDIGQNLPSTKEAFIKARKIIDQCLRHVSIDDEQWMINVCNEAGDPELVVLFPRPLTGNLFSGDN